MSGASDLGAYAATWVDTTAGSRVHFVRISRDGKRQGEERIFTRRSK